MDQGGDGISWLRDVVSSISAALVILVPVVWRGGRKLQELESADTVQRERIADNANRIERVEATLNRTIDQIHDTTVENHDKLASIDQRLALAEARLEYIQKQQDEALAKQTEAMECQQEMQRLQVEFKANLSEVLNRTERRTVQILDENCPMRRKGDPVAPHYERES